MHVLPPSTAPQHVAIIMDGNRRCWASQRSLPRALSHTSGARRVRQIVEACSARGVRYLTLFAFSTENWQRPADEVSSLMGLLVHYLQKEVSDMHCIGVRVKVVGDLSRFDERPELFIRPGGKSRISNFMLWQMAYTELFFTDTLRPDFSAPVLDQALQWFCARDRRIGASGSRLAC